MRIKKFVRTFLVSLGLIFSVPAFAAPINVLTLDETRVGVGSDGTYSLNFNFATGGSYQVVRDDLLNPANFGSGGIISRSVHILPTVPLLTPQSLSSVDIFVLPLNSSLSTQENDALRDFISSGGGMLLFSNWAAEGVGHEMFGTTAALLDTSPYAWVTDPTSPIIAGPFGTVDAPIDNPIGLMWNRSFDDLGLYGHEVLRNEYGVFGATFEYGNGRAVLFTDEELFMNPPAVSGVAAPNLSPRTEMLFLNSFAYAIPDGHAVPEPTTMLLLGSGFLGVVAMRRKIS